MESFRAGRMLRPFLTMTLTFLVLTLPGPDANQVVVQAHDGVGNPPLGPPQLPRAPSECPMKNWARERAIVHSNLSKLLNRASYHSVDRMDATLSAEMLTQVAELLGGILELHDHIEHVILCTREGVIVTAVARRERVDPRVLATVTSAIAWAGNTTFEKMSQGPPETILLTTADERIVALSQGGHHLVLVFSPPQVSDTELSSMLPSVRAAGARIEILMRSARSQAESDILGNIFKLVPNVTRAMLLTVDGLPLGSVGFENEIELAGLIGSMFANGLTFSETTDHIVLESGDYSLLIVRVDEARLLAVTLTGERREDQFDHVIDIVHQSV